ncbi:MAG: cell division protein FtsQ/DivIB [Demequinaceae bacterium]|nr:cell division protein FtsQ/DivIB [Demequinaceae bacterium]
MPSPGPSRPSAARIVVRRLGLLALVGALVWGVWWSPLFALRSEGVSISVDGSLVDPAEVREAVEPFIGVSLPRLGLDEVEAAVAAVPGVKGATATLSWPHGLAIEVVERVPIAAIADSRLGYLLVDVEGAVLASSTAAPEGMPVVTVPVGEENSRILMAALTVAGSLPPELAVRVEAVRAETEDSVTLFLRNGPRIEWGSAEDSALKAEVVVVLLGSDAASSAVIDVSAPTLPVTREG